MTCIITGCVAYDPDSNRAAWCDLHELGEVYIMHLASSDGREVAWTYGPQILDNTRTITFVNDWPGKVWEKGRVIVALKTACKLNPTAETYIADGRRLVKRGPQS